MYTVEQKVQYNHTSAENLLVIGFLQQYIGPFFQKHNINHVIVLGILLPKSLKENVIFTNHVIVIDVTMATGVSVRKKGI